MNHRILFFALALMVPSVLFSQSNKSTSDIQPALSRTGKITADWFDRTELTGKASLSEVKNILWYRLPAKVWEEALPVGNGKLGAMVFGGIADERIQFNESTLWDGYPMDPNNPESLKALPEVRRLLFENKNTEAVELASKTMMGLPKGIRSYQSLGELWMETSSLTAQNYIRTLDLATAIVTTRYESDGTMFSREVFASSVDNVIVMRITANKKGKINLTFTLKREQDAACKVLSSGPAALLLSGQLPTTDASGKVRGIKFAMEAKTMVDGGKTVVSNGLCTVQNANSLTIYIAGATNYPGLGNLARGITVSSTDPELVCTQTIAKAIKNHYAETKATHIKTHQSLFNRVDFNLGEVPDSIKTMPTNERLLLARKLGQPDAGLVETYFQYGRYLLICSSRPGGMPANLQGIWAWQMNPPWNADFHTNINVQMNYWPVEITNLSELHTPLFDLSDALVKPGERSAQVLYGAKGWVVHHLTDAWGFTAPADGPQGIWPMGSAWLAQHPWEHYCYTGDKDFLAKRGYPLMKGAARFIMDFLVEAPAGTAYAGKLVTNPSYSPENSFFLPDGKEAVFTYGATMDLEIIHDLLTHCIQACKILGVDADFRAECEKTLSRLAPIRISPVTGRIMEWAEDYKETEPHHRHTSHLFGLYPGNQITVNGTPELAAAARKTLEARGDDGTGWGLAWKINMWNRLFDGNHAYKLLSVLLANKTLPNLFDNHPPFQIDGNFGATAAIAEMMVQSQLQTSEGVFEVQLLPSLPSAWPSGSVKGLRARGGFEIDMTWKDGLLVLATIKSTIGGKLYLRFGQITNTYDTKKGEVLQLNGKLEKTK